MKRLLASCLLAAFFMGTAIPAAASAAPAISAEAAILVDGSSGRVLYAHHAEEERPIASITKLMTALVAVESTPLDRRIRIRGEWTGVEGSSMYLETGETLSLEELLYGLLLSSGNDAALAVAGGCAGDVDCFVDWMDQRAADLGMEHTKFSSPSGLQDEGNWSTARDMAVLARAVLADERLRTIVATKTITLGERTLRNHNKLLWRYEGCIGLKTGYTDRAGRTLVSAAERDGQTLIVVTLSDRDDWTDHAALLDYGFQEWPSHLLARAGKVTGRLPVTGGLVPAVPIETYSEVAYPLTTEESVRVEAVLPSRLEAPVRAGAIVGELRFSLEGTPIGRTYLVCGRDVLEDRPEQSLASRLMDWLQGGADRKRSGEEMTAAIWEPIRLPWREGSG